MEHIRRPIALLAILMLLTACAHTGADAPATSAAPVLDRIVSAGELVVGTAGGMPPLNMTTRQGEIIGFEIDIAKQMAQSMGVKLRIERLPFAQLLPALRSGKVDMVLSGMTITGKRNLNVAFVGPYFTSGKAFLTKDKTIAAASEGAEINSPERTLVALKGSTSQAFVEQVITKAKLIVTDTYEGAVEMVLNDQADALVADYPICLVSVLRHPDEGLVSIFTPITYEPIGVALPAGDPLLLNWVENFFYTLEGSGLLAELEERWLESSWWIGKLP